MQRYSASKLGFNSGGEREKKRKVSLAIFSKGRFLLNKCQEATIRQRIFVYVIRNRILVANKVSSCRISWQENTNKITSSLQEYRSYREYTLKHMMLAALVEPQWPFARPDYGYNVYNIKFSYKYTSDVLNASKIFE